ncbi:MAG TPA: PhzF family phenazine biosynthesis protein [Candidatus Polarisedimenticolaceae bacterium]|nr:PhzF family phenazine biosynthesis protein [Candidatus Polarisedimenticolaceae bacterium]
MSWKIFQVDAFADRPFAGNPAGVCLLEREAPEKWMQAVAAEMNVAETAFLVRRADGAYDLRWFTPTVEVDLCGHATLGSAHVLWEIGALSSSERAVFHTKSGMLSAWREDGMIRMDFPAEHASEAPAPPGLLSGLGVKPVFAGKNRFDWLIEVESEAAVRAVVPALPAIAAVGGRGVIVTARASSSGVDFVSRFFAPAAGVDEDPVTGSAHCALAPYWAAKLGKLALAGYQASRRGGTVHCRALGDRVVLGGTAVTVLRAELL